MECCAFRGKFGRALLDRAEKFSESLGWQGTVYVSMDTRPSSPSLKHRIISTLLKNGNTVIDIGIAPTQALSYCSKLRNSLGIMVTASHNAETDNGIKSFFGGVEAALPAYSPPKTLPAKCISSDFRMHYMQAVFSFIDGSDAIRSKKPKIIVDCGNSAASAFTPHLLRKAGASVITVDADSSTPFSRASEPAPAALSYLPKLVEECGADFAVAHDADGDRCRIVTKEGAMNQDIQLLLMARYLCRAGDAFVTTVEASQLVADELKKRGVNTHITPVGSNHVGRKIKEINASFGGEPCGEYVFPKLMHSADGTLAALMFAQLYCDRGFEKLKPYETVRGSVEVEESAKSDVMERIKQLIKSELGINDINELDGLLFQCDDAKVLIRKSNTQSLIRFTCEHKNTSKAKSVSSKIRSLIEEVV